MEEAIKTQLNTQTNKNHKSTQSTLKRCQNKNFIAMLLAIKVYQITTYINMIQNTRTTLN